MARSKRRKSRISSRLQFVTSAFSTMLVLVLLGLAVLVVMSARNLSVHVRENLTLSLSLSDAVGDAVALQLGEELGLLPYAKSVLYISKEEALAEETQALGVDPSEFLGYNPFSASIEVRLNAPYANSDSLAVIEQALMSLDGVSGVFYPGDLIDAINRNIGRVSIVLVGLATLLGFISFALINNTIKLSVYSNRFAINTMKLVGASRSFIRRPFISRHVFAGVAAALGANALIGCGLFALVRYDPRLLSVITPEVLAVSGASVVFLGIALTFVSSYFSLNGFLRMTSSELYDI